MSEEQFELSTDRLILRPHLDLDAEFMVALNADPEVTRFISGAPAFIRGECRIDTAAASPLTLESARNLIHDLRRQFRERRMGRFIVVSRITRERLGWCGLKPIEPDPQAADLGYRFMRRFWGQGFATEAAQACIHYGFDELELRTLTAEVEAANGRSIRVLTKLGFHPCGKVEGVTATWLLRAP